MFRYNQDDELDFLYFTQTMILRIWGCRISEEKLFGIINRMFYEKVKFFNKVYTIFYIRFIKKILHMSFFLSNYGWMNMDMFNNVTYKIIRPIYIYIHLLVCILHKYFGTITHGSSNIKFKPWFICSFINRKWRSNFE